MKDHEIAKLHNDLRDTAIKYRDAEQLRARLVAVIAPLTEHKLSEKDIKTVKENLCAYDKRNPYYCDAHEDEKGKRNCFCDCCFRGNTGLAEMILELIGEE